jgi:hypothetical protein
LRGRRYAAGGWCESEMGCLGGGCGEDVFRLRLLVRSMEGHVAGRF